MNDMCQSQSLHLWHIKIFGLSGHLERSHLLLYGIVYKVIRWRLYELKRDLLYFLDVCNNIIAQHINVNPMKQCFFMQFDLIYCTDLLL